MLKRNIYWLTFRGFPVRISARIPTVLIVLIVLEVLFRLLDKQCDS
jgi:hypothetical protein